VPSKAPSKAVKIEVDGETLMVLLEEDAVTVTRVIGRDRKNKTDIVWSQPTVDRPSAAALLATLKHVAARQTAPCTCGYHYGWSDHAEHCKSIRVAEEYRDEDG
jgi:hypothetical protein